MPETEQVEPELAEYSDYYESVAQPGFASRLQMFAVIVYLISQGFTIPILPIGPSWAVWPRLDDFTTAFLFLVYLSTRGNTSPMNKAERFVFVLVAIGVVLSVPSTFFGRFMRPEILKGSSYGIFQTFRVFEYGMVWFCIRGMTFSQKQFDKISYTIFFIVIFVVIIGLGNATGLIPPARFLTHLPYDGPWGVLKTRGTGAFRPVGPYGWNSGYMVDQLVFMTAILLVSRKPSVIFRIPLVVLVAVVVFLTGSRAATVAWCTCLVILAHKSIKQLVVMLVVVSMFFGALYVSADYFDIDIVERATHRAGTLLRRETIEEKTLSGRTVQWATAVDYIFSNPSVSLMGVGWGFGGVVLVERTGIGHVHCMYLDVLLELGVFGAVMFYILLFNMYRLLQGRDRFLTAMRAAFIALLVAGITGGVFYPVVASGSFLGFAGAVFAIGSAASRGRALEEQYYGEYEFIEEEETGEF